MVNEEGERKKNIWEYVTHLQRLADIYQNDLGKEEKILFDELSRVKSHIHRNRQSKLDLERLHSFCLNEWEKVIKKIISILLSRIETRRTRGSEFSEIKIQLNKLREDIEVEDYDLNQYLTTYEYDLRGFREQIKEKLDNETHIKREFWKGIIIGAIVGFTLSLLGDIAYDWLKSLII